MLFYQAHRKFLSELKLVWLSFMWSLTAHLNTSVLVELLWAYLDKFCDLVFAHSQHTPEQIRGITLFPQAHNQLISKP